MREIKQGHVYWAILMLGLEREHEIKAINLFVPLDLLILILLLLLLLRFFFRSSLCLCLVAVHKS